jgi:hypothetical protein
MTVILRALNIKLQEKYRKLDLMYDKGENINTNSVQQLNLRNTPCAKIKLLHKAKFVTCIPFYMTKNLETKPSFHEPNIRSSSRE